MALIRVLLTMRLYPLESLLIACFAHLSIESEDREAVRIVSLVLVIAGIQNEHKKGCLTGLYFDLKFRD